MKETRVLEKIGLISTDEFPGLLYDPETGDFIRDGRLSGSFDSYGYRVTQYNKKNYKHHRLAWFFMTGQWPEKFIDHIDGDPSNNTWVNLREATNQQNCWNSGVRKNNKLGVKGVSLHSCGKYAAQIQAGPKKEYLGLFDSIEEASAAYKRASKRLHKEFSGVTDE